MSSALTELSFGEAECAHLGRSWRDVSRRATCRDASILDAEEERAEVYTHRLLDEHRPNVTMKEVRYRGRGAKQ